MKLNKFILPIAAIFFVTQASADPYIGASYLYSEYQAESDNTVSAPRTHGATCQCLKFQGRSASISGSAFANSFMHLTM